MSIAPNDSGVPLVADEATVIAASRWSVYMLRCGDGSLYTGIAIDVLRRVAEHETGPRGSRYLRGRGPLKIVFQAQIGDRGLATRVELRIKRLGKVQKEKLILAPARIDELIQTGWPKGDGPPGRQRATAVQDTEPPGVPEAT